MKTIRVGKLTINPSLERNVEEIHPAIGTVDNTAYVGVWLPCEITDDKDNITYRDLLFLVTDKREILLANNQVFREQGSSWKLEYRPIKFPNRWSLNQVQAYLDGNTVDPIQVFNHVYEAWQKYMELPSENEYIYQTLWSIGTYFHHLFNCYPYIYFGGLKRSGKTKALTLHYCLAFNAIFSNNMSSAAIYRLVQNARACMLIDESEKLSYKGQMSERTLEFRSILLSGYKKGARAYRIEKTQQDRFQPQPFEVYSPKALANIRGLEDVIEDRCKPTILRRSRSAKIMNLEVSEHNNEFSELRSSLYLLYLVHWREIKGIYDGISGFSEHSESMNIEKIPDLELLVGRELELWKGIIALAVFFDKKRGVNSMYTSSLSSLTTSILQLAVEDAKQRRTENTTETGEVILVQVLRPLVIEDNYYRVKTLKEKMAEAFDEEQKWLTTRWVGNALRRLGFKDKRRVGTGYEYKLTKIDVEDIASRLGLEEKNNIAPSVPSDPSDTDSDSRDAKDASVTSSSRQLHSIEDLVSFHWVDEKLTEHECGVCGYPKKTAHKGLTNKNDEIWICEFCYDLAVKTQREV